MSSCRTAPAEALARSTLARENVFRHRHLHQASASNHKQPALLAPLLAANVIAPQEFRHQAPVPVFAQALAHQQRPRGVRAPPPCELTQRLPRRVSRWREQRLPRRGSRWAGAPSTSHGWSTRPLQLVRIARLPHPHCSTALTTSRGLPPCQTNPECKPQSPCHP